MSVVSVAQRIRPEGMADLLRRAIRDGVLSPGQSLVQDELARRFGVSRIPVREALRLLASEGLVSMRSGEGAVVTRLDADEIRELYDLRLSLEPPLTGPIVANCSGRDIDRLESFTAEMEAVADTDSLRWSVLNYLFHRSMYELAERPHTLRVIDQVLNLVEPYSRVYVHVLAGLDRAQGEHADMIATLRARNADALAAAIRSHLTWARDGLVTSTEAQQHIDPLDRLVGMSGAGAEPAEN